MNNLNLSEAQYGDVESIIFIPIFIFLASIVFFDTGCIRHDERKGTKQIQTYATELAGGTPTTTVKNQTYTRPPILTITSPSNGNRFVSSSISVYGTVSDNYGLPVSVTVNGISATVSGNSFFTTGITLSGITNTIQAIGVDSVGLRSITSVSATYQTAPTMSVAWAYPSQGDVENSTSIVAELDFTDTVSGINYSSIGIKLDGSPVNVMAEESYNDNDVFYLQDLAAGQHTLVASVLNGQGLLFQTATTFTVQPAISITSISPNPASIGQIVTIYGAGLNSANSICLTGDAGDNINNKCMLELYLPSGGGISPNDLYHDNDGSISFHVPYGAVTGDVAIGNVLSVSNHLTLAIKPTIMNVLPYDVGSSVVYNYDNINIRQYRTTNANGQKIISIYAAGLSNFIKDDSVSLNGINCPVGNVESGGLIKALIPVGIHSGKLVITVNGISSDPVMLRITNEKTYVNSNPQNMSNSGPFTRSMPVNLPPLVVPNSRTLPPNNAIVTMGPKTTGVQHPSTTSIGSFTSWPGSSVINSLNYSNLISGQTASRKLKLTILISGAPISISGTSLTKIRTSGTVKIEQTVSKIHLAALSRKCDTGDYEACVDGFLFYITTGDYRFYVFIKKLVSLKQGAAFLQPRCLESKNGKYCLMLGEMYLAGEGIVQNFSKALFNFHKACEVGNEVGCSEVGYMYEEGKGVAQDYAKAVFLYEKSCKKGDGEGCDNLGYMYYKGLGVAQDYEKTASFLQKACDAGVVSGCMVLGNMYYTGKEVPRNYNSAISFFQKACSMGNADGCNDCGGIYLIGKDYSMASSYYQMACDMGNAVGCNSIGLLYFLGRGVPQDYSQAKSLMKKGCDKGDSSGCMDLGNIYLVGQGEIAQNYSASVSLFQKACDLGDVSGCISLGNMYYVGKGVTQNYSKAAQFFEKACNRGNGFSCNGLGFLYFDGKGRTQNYSKAISMFQKACDLGSKDGCRNLHILQKRDSYNK